MRKGVVVAFSVFLSVAIVGLTLLSAAWIARDCAMPQRVDAALRAVDHLQQQGYRFVTGAELLALKGVEPEGGEVYRSVS